MSCIGWGVSSGGGGASVPDDDARAERATRGTNQAARSWGAVATAIEAAYRIVEGGDGQLAALAETLGVDAWRCADDDGASEVGFVSPALAGTGLAEPTFVAHTVSDGARCALEVFRARPSSHRAPLDETLLLAVAPHVARAARLRLRLHEATAASREPAALVQALPVPAFLVDGGARVLLGNDVATELLQTNPRLRVANGTLGGGSPADTATLLARIANVACGPREGRAEAVVLRGLAEAPVRLVLSRFPSRAGWASSHLDRARVLVLVMDPASARPLDRALVETLYELTPTEASLACGLAEGSSVHDLARDRSLSLHTVRTHFKRIFDKTGTHRQAELVRLLAVVACGSLLPVWADDDPGT